MTLLILFLFNLSIIEKRVLMPPSIMMDIYISIAILISIIYIYYMNINIDIAIAIARYIDTHIQGPAEVNFV